MKPETDGHAPRGDPAGPPDFADALRDPPADATPKMARLASVRRRSSKQDKAPATLTTNPEQLDTSTEEPR